MLYKKKEMTRKMSKMNKKLCLAACLIVIWLVFISNSKIELKGQNISSSSWSRARVTFEEFLRRPDNLTAWEFLNSIPADVGENVDKEKFIKYLDDNNRRYEIIMLEMEAGNKYAARAAIRLLPFLEGKIEDKLRMSLSELVRINPEIFLRACYEERDSLFIRTNGYPVSHLAEAMEYNREIAYFELQKRKEALRSVEGLELQPIRNKCLQSIENRMKELGIKGIACGKGRLRISGNLIQNIKSAFDEIIKVPCPENFKQLVDLLPERANNDVSYLLEQLLFPKAKSPDYGKQEILPYIIWHEARCGNEDAIELLFVLDSFYYCMDIYNMIIEGAINALILSNPALFVEKLAKYQKRFRSQGKIIDICTDQIYCGYPDESTGAFILEKRVVALEGLNMPQYKEVIEHCIRILKDEIEIYRKPVIRFKLHKK